jgi:hypothetical protein
MRNHVKRIGGWLIIPLALLAFVSCETHFEIIVTKGSQPWTGKIFCAIEQHGGRHCANADDLATGVRLASAAEALVDGRTSMVGLDDSPAALARCNGTPEAVLFEGAFPEGTEVCLNCSVITPPVDANVMCRMECENKPEASADPNVKAECATRAHVAVNVDPAACFADACSADGAPLENFVDPRRSLEPVIWQDLIGVTTSGGGNTLTRTAAFTGSFDAGAASSQLITGGDAFVEFTAAETTTARLAGLSEGTLPDTTPTIAITFAIDLFKDGCVYIFENGNKVLGPDLTCSAGGGWGAYAAGDRFRIHVRDNQDGTAAISYARLTTPCTDGMPCPETTITTSFGTAHYPLHVDSSFRELNGTLGNVRLVRIR